MSYYYTNNIFEYLLGRNMEGKSGELGNLISREILPFGGKFATWREISVNEIKKYIRNGGKFGYTEGKYLTIFPGNVAFFPAVGRKNKYLETKLFIVYLFICEQSNEINIKSKLVALCVECSQNNVAIS